MKQKPISQPWLRFGKHAFLFLALSASLNAWAQSDTIRILNLKTYAFEKNGFRIPPNTLVNEVAGVPEATSLAKLGSSSRVLSIAFGSVGGFALGFVGGSALFSGEVNWPIFGVGLALTGLSIPVSIQSKRQFKESIELYNAHIRKIKPERRPIIIGLGPGGLRLVKAF